MRKLALHQATTRDWTLEQDLRGCQQAGYDGIGIFVEFLHKFIERDRVEAIKLVKESGLQVSDVAGARLFEIDERGCPRPRIDETRALVDLARDLEAESLLVIFGPGGRQRMDDIWRLSLDVIAAILPYAEEQGVRLGIEPMHPVYMPEWSICNTIEDTIWVLDQFPSPNLGIILDAWHIWWEKDLFALIDRCRGRIAGVHLCDWRAATRSILNERTLPGEGVIPLREFCHAVEAAGWIGCWDIEIFSEQHWSEDYDEVLRRCKHWFESVWS